MLARHQHPCFRRGDLKASRLIVELEVEKKRAWSRNEVVSRLTENLSFFLRDRGKQQEMINFTALFRVR